MRSTRLPYGKRSLAWALLVLIPAAVTAGAGCSSSGGSPDSGSDEALRTRSDPRLAEYRKSFAAISGQVFRASPPEPRSVAL